METTEIQNKAKFITNSKGKPVEVILPIGTYQQLVDLQTSIEIFQQKDTQQSISRAKNEIANGNTVSFKNMDEATEWLDK